MTGRCATCKHWDRLAGEELTNWRRKRVGLKVLGKCKRAEDAWNCDEPPVADDAQMFTEDGSNYYSALLTAETFGCIQYEGP